MIKKNIELFIIVTIITIMFTSYCVISVNVVKDAKKEINFGDILEVNITIENPENSTINVSVKEYVTDAEPVDPESLIEPNASDLKIGWEPSFYLWNIVLQPISTHTITYKIKPLSFGDFSISPTKVQNDAGETFYSNTLTVSVKSISNGVCEPEKGENYLNNPQDCPTGSADYVCDLIEDNVCDPDCSPDADPDCVTAPSTSTIPICNNDGLCDERETYQTCPQDCPKSAFCGNGECEDNETKDNCCKDCGCNEGNRCLQNRCMPDLCGNRFCEPKFEENYNTCKEDCPSGSKDGYCDGLADGECDSDCRTDEDIDCVKSVDNSLVYVIITVIAIVLISLIIIMSRREK